MARCRACCWCSGCSSCGCRGLVGADLVVRRPTASAVLSLLRAPPNEQPLPFIGNCSDEVAIVRELPVAYGAAADDHDRAAIHLTEPGTPPLEPVEIEPLVSGSKGVERIRDPDPATRTRDLLGHGGIGQDRPAMRLGERTRDQPAACADLERASD